MNWNLLQIAINESIAVAGGAVVPMVGFWPSTEISSGLAYIVWRDTYVDGFTKDFDKYYVRPFAML